MKSKFLFFILVIHLTYFTSLHARIVNVSTAAQIKAAINAIQPGDTIIIANGTYDLNTYQNVATSGTSDQPILITAQTIGGVTFINKSLFDLKQVSYVTIQGFNFKSANGTVIKIESCSYCRVTRNIFHSRDTSSQKWIIIQDLYNATQPLSHHNRIDHNLFENKSFAGNCITIDGFQGTPARSSQYDRIDHNHFRNVGPRIENEMETIRVGVSSLTGTSGYTVIEYNLFEDCDGDPEFVSLKTDDDTVRYNTFRSCQGTLCFRQTARSVAYGNYFIGNGKAGTGGVRVYKNDNKIFNNYFVDLKGTTWDAACTITNGDVDSNSTSASSHFRPIRTIFAFNTLINCESNIEIGFTNSGAYGKPPRDNVIANNIITATRNPIVKILTNPVGQVWQGNIFFPKDSATIGISATTQQIWNTDPKLQLLDSIWRLTSVSPAINAALGNYPYVVEDIDGQTRTSPNDVGADEYHSAIPNNYPLGPNDVGPNARDITVDIEEKYSASMKDHQLYQNYPNPFNPSTTIQYSIARPGMVSMKVYDILGNEVRSLMNEEKAPGNYAVEFDASDLSSGVYFYTLKTSDFIAMKKMIVLK